MKQNIEEHDIIAVNKTKFLGRHRMQ